ncbi:MAG: hypothetical protein ACLVGL_07400 [Waltera sp.]
MIDHYIYILNVRFSGDIHYGKEIAEDLLDSCRAQHDPAAHRGKLP